MGMKEVSEVAFPLLFFSPFKSVVHLTVTRFLQLGMPLKAPSLPPPPSPPLLLLPLLLRPLLPSQV